MTAVGKTRSPGNRNPSDRDRPGVCPGGPPADPAVATYRLDDQVGFLLRQASQRHTTLFAGLMTEGLTPTRFAALARLHEMGPLSQNELGRQTAMDVATIKGVVDRLCDRGLTVTRADPSDGRRHLVELTALGQETIRRAQAQALEITERTLAPLKPQERASLIRLLRKIG